MASVEAVARRRANRRARKEQRERRREREVHQAGVAKRMVVRFFGTMPPHLMVLGYMYWQARRCGWDALSPYISVDAKGRRCDPTDGVAWRFWTALHYKTREELVRLSSFRLIRRR
jgi:hypothetical protein